MAKSNRPIKVLVHPSLFGTIAVQELIEKKNQVDCMDTRFLATYTDVDLSDYDLILGPNCYRIVPGMENHIEYAVKAARRTKYGKRAEKGDEDTT